jgi:hypothetical protein
MPTNDSLQLHDIHLPDSANIWPIAFGWWVLLLLLLIAIGLLIRFYKKHLKQQRKKFTVLKQLKKLENQLRNNPDNETLAKVNILLRQLAITHYPRSDIASLTGSSWLHFLDRSGKTHDFSKGAGRILIEAPYRAGKLQNLNLEEFIPMIRKWVSRVVKKKKTNYKREIS